MQNFNLIKPEYLQYMMPMGRLKAVKNISNPLLKNSGFLRQADIPALNQVEQEMANYARRTAREMAARYKEKMAQESFERATQNFNPSKILNNFIK